MKQRFNSFALLALTLLALPIHVHAQAVAVPPQSLSARVVYLSKAGIVANGTTNQATALQAIFNRNSTGGALEVVNDLPGVLMTSGNDVYSNTTVRTLPGGTWKLAPGSSRGILRNATVTASYPTGVTKPNGTISTGPTAPVDTNIELIGGTYDGNRRGGAFSGVNGRTNDTTPVFISALQFFGVKNLTLRNLRVYDSPTFGFHVANLVHVIVTDCQIENPSVIYASNQDGFHANGPVDDMQVTNLKVTQAGDDSFALNADDGHEPGATADAGAFGNLVGWGPITHVRVNGLQMTRCLFGIRLLSAIQRVDDIVISDVHGESMADGIQCDTFSIPGGGSYGRLTFDNIAINSIPWSPDSYVGATVTYTEAQLGIITLRHCHIDSLNLRNIGRDMATTRPYLTTRYDTDIDNINVDGFSLSDRTSTAAGVSQFVFAAGTTVKNMSVRGVNWTSSYTQTGSFISNSGAITLLTASNVALPNSNIITGTAAVTQKGDAFASGGASPPPPAATVYTNNTFTAADGTSLTAYVPDVGPTWTMPTGTFSVQSNTLRSTGADGNRLAAQNAGFANVIVTTSVKFAPGGQSQLAAHVIDANNFVAINITGINTVIYEVVGGVATQIGSGAATGISSSTAGNVTITCNGSAITVTANGVSVSGTLTNASIIASTKFGVGGYGPSGDEYDNYKITSL